MNKKTMLLTLTIMIVSACGKNEKSIVKKAHHFFENSKRSTIKSTESNAMGIAKIGTCTGFFLKNENNKNYIASARHCFKYDADSWCDSNSATDHFGKDKLACLAVAVGDEFHDMVILEFESSKRNRSNDFELADFDLDENMMLAMLGFPADPYNTNLALKLTQHCWVKSPTGKNGHTDINVRDDRVFKHNCSTYGGNSGGPMFIEGTRIAIGLPDAYKPQHFKNDSVNSSTQGVLASGFVDDFRDEISDLGIATTKIKKSVTPNFITVGSFNSTTSNCKIQLTNVVYNTNSFPTKISVAYSGENCGSTETYTCKSNHECVDSTNETGLKMIDGESFQYFWLSKPEHKSLFHKA